MMSGSQAGLGERHAVAIADLGDLGRIGCPDVGDLDELAEESLEPGWADDLDHPSGRRARVPHRVDLVARLDDVATGAKDDLVVLRAEADLAFEHVRDLVLAGVDVGWHECADRERMLDDRQRATRVLGVDLEGDPDAGRQSAGPTLALAHDLQSRSDALLDCHLAPPTLFE